ncbi:MAG: hypothetical protein HUJ60_01660 [Bacilli bacterium]|nr:hypothetical protein [Bacilli bacterium]
MKKKWIIALSCVGVLAVATVVTWMAVGLTIEWGPFAFMAFDAREREIVKKYDANERKGEIVFYGASNFRLWKEMDEDMLPYVVQNHGFGGSTDKDLMERADRLLYPYDPSVVVFQTASNDYAKTSGTDEEIYNSVTNSKKTMFETFHEKMPNARFVVIAGILMPGRSQYDGIVSRVNAYLKEYCEKAPHMYYVDSEAMTVDENGQHKTDMFISDGIHLTHESRLMWANDYIKPTLKTVFEENPGLLK